MLRVGGTDGINNQTLSVNSSGHLNIADGGNSITVDGTFWQATQPVSLASVPSHPVTNAGTFAVQATQAGTWNIGSITSLPALAAGTNNIGDVDVASLPGTVAADIAAIKVATELLDNAYGASGSSSTLGMLRVGGTDGTNNRTFSVNSSGHLNIADGGNSITVDGTVGISGTVPVSGTFWQTTQPVSGTVGISGTVPISGALTDTQLRATAVPVSLASVPAHAVTNAGTFAVQVDGAALTALQLIDDTIIADNTAIGSTKIIAVGGTDGTNSQMLSVNTSGHVNIADGGNSITVDGTFWQATQPVSIATAVPITDNSSSLTVDAPVATPVYVRLSNGTAAVDTLPVSLASVPSHPVTNAGTFAVQATQAGTWNIGSITSLPALAAGTNTIGKVDVNGTVPVSGTFWQATQPVSIATLPALAAGTNNIGVVSFSPNALVANAPTNASTTAYAASLIVKATAGVLYIITGFNSRSSGQFIQIFDSATLPADTSVPKVIFYVESNSNFSFDLGAYGRAFSSGIVICNSSTGPTKKIGAADCWFDVQYK